MNKDVVYIEPEDDITDIISRVKGAKLKLVALVPPKKIGVLRSAVNTKLVAKAAKQAGKVVVIVTTDPALIKLAAAAQIPVAKSLQSRPKLPSEINSEARESAEQVIDESDFGDEIDAEAAGAAGAYTAGKNASENGRNARSAASGSANATNAASAANSANSAGSARNSSSDRSSVRSPRSADQDFTSDDLDKDEKHGKTGKKGQKSDKKGIIPVIEKYRKWFIIGAVALVLLIILGVWAFVFAPAAKISVAIRTTTNNFSENISFTTNSSSEKASDGVFYLKKESVEKSSSVEFTATGQKDLGEKAKGTLKLTATFSTDTVDSTISVPSGSVFSRGEYQYVTQRGLDFRLDDQDDCSVSQLRNGTCTITADVAVVATESGDKYNIGAYDSGWSSPVAGITASNSSAFSGGTTNVVTVVSQSDFDNAKEKLNNQGKEDGKSELTAKFGSNMLVIESSLEVSTSAPQCSPAVGEEVKSGATPKVTASTTYSMFAVEKEPVESYVKDKTEDKLASDQRIYAVDTPFFESFSKESDTKYTARLKSSTQTGPRVNEEDILEKAKGRKVGEVQSLLKSINGVSSVNITTSFPWVRSVPNDPNKITIELKVEG